MAPLLITLFTSLTRLACVGFLCIAGFTIPQVWKLNVGGYHIENGTLFIPLEICEPVRVTVDGNDFNFLGKDIGHCHTLDYLVNACAASIIFAMAAMVVFYFFDALARCNTGPVNRSSTLGMSFFMTFILIQAAACCFALYKECKFWEDYYLTQFEELPSNHITTVDTYGKKTWFIFTCLTALITAALLLLDTLLCFCWGVDKRKGSDESRPRPEPKPSEPAQSTATSDPSSSVEHESMENSAPADNDYPKKWTNY